jgi:glutamine synthetase
LSGRERDDTLSPLSFGDSEVPMAVFADLKRRIEDEGIEFVDFRVVDLVGRWRHISIPAARLVETILHDGIGFDASNYGYRGVAGSDMVLVPDLSTAFVEERDGEPILACIADICDAATRERSRADPRAVAQASVTVLRERGIADEVLVSPEFEFYVFESIQFASGPGSQYVEIEAVEGAAYRETDEPWLGAPSAYHAPFPEDRLFGLRCEIARRAAAAGVDVKYHHHEVGSFGQQEIELGFAPLVQMADATLLMKSLVRSAADEAGLTATFLPKPMVGQAGNGMHLHQYLTKAGKNQFRGRDGLSDLAYAYIAGLLVHGRSLMGLTNPSTNSYRRLVPGYEAPVSFTFGSANRSAAVRIPAYARGDDMRMELRTMDATCNPYLAFAAILLAGLDGIDKKLDARALGFGPIENDTCDNLGESAPDSLEDALDALETDHNYLTATGVFSEAGIEAWLRLKRQEAAAVALHPHPHEFSLYYDL